MTKKLREDLSFFRKSKLTITWYNLRQGKFYGEEKKNQKVWK